MSSETLDVRKEEKKIIDFVSERVMYPYQDFLQFFRRHIVKLGWIGFVKRGIGLVEETWSISKTKLGAGRLEYNGVFKE